MVAPLPKGFTEDDRAELTRLLEEVERRKENDGWKWVRLTPGQRKFVESAKKMELCLSGNRGGKTFSGLYKVNLICLDKHPTLKFGKNVIAYTASDSHGKGAEIFLPILKKIIPKRDQNFMYGSRGELMGVRYRSTNAMWRFKSFEAGRESVQGAYVHVFHADEEPPEGFFEEGLMRGATVGGVVMLTMTAIRGMTWVYRRLYLPGQNPEMAKKMDLEVFRLSVLDAPWIPQEEKERWKYMYDEDEYRIRILGEFVHRQGLVYPNFSDQVHVVPPISRLDPSWEISEVMDPGHHHWAVGFFATDEEGRILQFDELHETGGATVPAMQELIHQKREKWGYRQGARRLADPHSWAHGEGQSFSIAEQFERGKHPISFDPGIADHNAGLVRVRAYLTFEKDHLGRASRPFFQVTENCQNTIFEFQNYLWKNSDPSQGDDRTDKKNDHNLDCLKWLVLDLPEPAFMLPEKQADTWEGMMQRRLVRKMGDNSLVIPPPTALVERKRLEF